MATAAGDKPAALKLVWRQPDHYHIVTADGRYSVCRINLGPRIRYCAFLRGSQAPGRYVAAVEIGSIDVSRDAADEALLTAIKAMQKRCAEHAGLT